MKTFKSQKETEREYKHVKVFDDGVYIGYMLYNVPKYPNWSFSLEQAEFPMFTARTRNELIEMINKL